MSPPPVPPADRGVPSQGTTPPPPRGPGAGHPDDPEHDPTGIRALLSALPDPGPMPADLVARISASIAQEQSARQGSTVVPLRRRTWGWQHLGAAAAAAVVLAVGIPALLTGTGPGDMVASLKGTSSADSASSAEGNTNAQADSGGAPADSGGSPAAPGPTAVPPPSLDGSRVGSSVGDVALAATGTAYTTAGLATQAQTLGTTFAASSAAKDHAVPHGAAGLRACLTALGVPPGLPVRGDVATLDGSAAVIALVDRGSTESVYAVSPGCDAQHPTLLAGPLTLP